MSMLRAVLLLARTPSCYPQPVTSPCTAVPLDGFACAGVVVGADIVWVKHAGAGWSVCEGPRCEVCDLVATTEATPCVAVTSRGAGKLTYAVVHDDVTTFHESACVPHGRIPARPLFAHTTAAACITLVAVAVLFVRMQCISRAKVPKVLSNARIKPYV